MKTMRLAGAAMAAVWMGLVAVPAHAATTPAIVDISVDSQACASICFQLTVDNPAPGKITLRLTGHTPGGGDTWVDVGAAHKTVDVVAGQTTYQACFGDVTQLIAGKGFNSLRIDVVSSTIPGLTGTATKSASFSCTGGTGGSGSGSGSSGSGGGSGAAGSGSTSTALAQTGGLDFRLPLVGVLLLAAGLLLLLVGRARGRANP